MGTSLPPPATRYKITLPIQMVKLMAVFTDSLFSAGQCRRPELLFARPPPKSEPIGISGTPKIFSWPAGKKARRKYRRGVGPPRLAVAVFRPRWRPLGIRVIIHVNGEAFAVLTARGRRVECV